VKINNTFHAVSAITRSTNSRHCKRAVVYKEKSNRNAARRRNEIWECMIIQFPMRFPTAQQTEFSHANKCHICEKVFEPDDKPVRDHCHITGEYRGQLTTECNLKYRVPIKFLFIPQSLQLRRSHFNARGGWRHGKGESVASQRT